MTEARGSTTRKYTTALTFTVTLSRVITSWGGTSRTTVRRLTRIIRSMGQATMMRPGPFGFRTTFPTPKTPPPPRPPPPRARARQRSPCTRTQPQGSRSVSATPSRPTIPSTPVAARRRWACRTRRTSARVKPANTTISGASFQGSTRSSGSGESTSIMAPSIMATSPPTVNRPYEVTLISAMNKVIAGRVDGDDLAREEEEDQTERPHDPGEDHPGMADLGSQAGERPQQQQEQDLRLRDRGEDGLSPVHGHLH